LLPLSPSALPHAVCLPSLSPALARSRVASSHKVPPRLPPSYPAGGVRGCPLYLQPLCLSTRKIALLSGHGTVQSRYFQVTILSSHDTARPNTHCCMFGGLCDTCSVASAPRHSSAGASVQPSGPRARGILAEGGLGVRSPRAGGGARDIARAVSQPRRGPALSGSPPVPTAITRAAASPGGGGIALARKKLRWRKAGPRSCQGPQFLSRAAHTSTRI
jgi:hypothetical protein